MEKKESTEYEGLKVLFRSEKRGKKRLHVLEGNVWIEKIGRRVFKGSEEDIGKDMKQMADGWTY